MSKDANHPPDGADDRPEHYLKEWREFMDWSQEELGEMVSAHQSKIQRIETGKRGLKTGFLQDLARVFGVPPSALLEVNPSTEEWRADRVHAVGVECVNKLSTRRCLEDDPRAQPDQRPVGRRLTAKK